MLRSLVATLLALPLSALPLRGQTTGATHTGSGAASLADFVGTYRYHGGASLALVAADSQLIAIIDEGKYPLRPVGRDRFVNGPGDTIPFRRAASGEVEGFTEGGAFYARLSSQVDSTVTGLFLPRPHGRDGQRLAYRYQAPPDLHDGIAVGRLQDVGLDSSIAYAVVNGVVEGRYPDLHSILIFRRGRLVLEEYFHGYHVSRPHQMRSATKSIVSTLVGIAVDQGTVAEPTQERVLARLPYRAYSNTHPAKQEITLHELLTHQTGLACDDWDRNSPGNEVRIYASADWVKAFLDLPMIAPGGASARYCSAGVVTAGRIVELAAGESLPTFAQRTLFDPLGIPPESLRWNFSLTSDNAGSFAQLYLRPRDMLKFGILIHQQGRWGGRQIVSPDWVRRATAQQTQVGDQGYGYYWWHQWMNVPTPEGNRRVDMVVATGNGGQKIFLIPSLDVVAVFTGGAYNAENTPPNAIMRQVLLPAILTSRMTRPVP